MISIRLKQLLTQILTISLAAVIFSAHADTAKIGNTEGKLDVVAWPGYLENGASDKNYDWVTGFEKRNRLQGQR